MKNQSYGCSNHVRLVTLQCGKCRGHYSLSWRGAARVAMALKQYREERENGNAIDDPGVFPSGGLDTLDIKTSSNSDKGWPDKEGRYWWKIVCQTGQIIEDFYWTKDTIRGWPDKTNKNRHWFIVYGPNGVRMDGFSSEPSSDKRNYPDYDGFYWVYTKYTESGVIADWMRKKDENYSKRIKSEKEYLDQLESIKPIRANPAKLQKEMESDDMLSDILSFSKLCSSDPVGKNADLDEAIKIEVPMNYRCPITREIMFEPVIAMDGHTYECEAIQQALKENLTSPMTGELMESDKVLKNFSLHSMIREFLDQNPGHWPDVYVTSNLIKRILLVSPQVSDVEIGKWRNILNTDPRLLTIPLSGNATLVEYICLQSAPIIKIYLPIILDLLIENDWKKLMYVHSATEWLTLVADACDKGADFSLGQDFTKGLQMGLKVKIAPLEFALYALRERNISLFKLAVSGIVDLNEPIDAENNTLLHFAAQEGQRDMVRHLAEQGANLKQKNLAGLNAEELARQAGFEDTAHCLSIFKIASISGQIGVFSPAEQSKAAEKNSQRAEPSFVGIQADNASPLANPDVDLNTVADEMEIFADDPIHVSERVPLSENHDATLDVRMDRTCLSHCLLC